MRHKNSMLIAANSFLLGITSLFLIDSLHAQQLDFGDDSSSWARNGECDDPRFEGTGMASYLIDSDKYSDATDCEALFNLGRITLITTLDVDFGDDSSPWARDGECDDSRFQGIGMAASISDDHRFRDATDCQALFNLGEISFATEVANSTEIEFGNDSSTWSNDGECDDPRFEGSGMASYLTDADRYSDATDCESLFNLGRISLINSTEINFGDDSSSWATDGECDDPRFEGPGMADYLVEDDRYSDATDCALLFDQGEITMRSGWDYSDDNYPDIGEIGLNERELMEVSSGTGFFVSEQGHMLTNHHVIDGCQDVRVHIDGIQYKVTVVAVDTINDLALIKSDLVPTTTFPISSDEPYILQNIFVAGYPFGEEISSSVKVTSGIVSSLTGIGDNVSNIQIDAALQPGNSGGPIIDENGNVIAVAVAKLDYATILDLFDAVPENVNFGIRSSVANSLLSINNISMPEAGNIALSQFELGRRVTEGTVYLSCWMSSSDIGAARLLRSLFEGL